MIIETSANELFRVRETGNPDLAHVWLGIAVSLAKAQLVTNGCYCDYNDENGHYGRSPIVRFLIAVN